MYYYILHGVFAAIQIRSLNQDSNKFHARSICLACITQILLVNESHCVARIDMASIRLKPVCNSHCIFDIDTQIDL